MYERILLPLDGSPLSEAVIPHALELARRFGSEVVLLEAVKAFGQVLQETRPGGGVQPGTEIELSVDVAKQQVEAETRSAAAYLDSVAERFEEEGVKVRTIVIEGGPARSILDYARDWNPSLIVMSTHGRSGLSRLIAGSVADEVIRNTNLPIMILRPEK